MKFLFVASIILSSLLLSGCETANPKTDSTEEGLKTQDVREIAWNSLTNSEKEEVIGEWKDATTNKVTADPKRYGLDDRSYVGKEVTMVTFILRTVQS
jgi:PBP1b-binding outer membrane lipoprotein LpoB